LCEAIAKAYHLEDDVIAELKIAGELHDIGKIAIDESILNKSDKLSETEKVQMEHHPETGYRLLSTSREHYNIAEYVLSHHERWDGAGYPKNIKGAEIHWGARVIAIAESYEAMTSERFYQKARSSEEAAAEIKKCSGTQFDPVIARVFVEKVLGLAW
ncbi:MAG TPA: HD domain-containing phosphohydrolase, partial [Clostridia bacterium]